MSGFLAYLRQQASLPESERDVPLPEPTAEQIAAREADLARRLDIAATSGPKSPGSTHHVIHVPQCMLDAFGLEEMDHE